MAIKLADHPLWEKTEAPEENPSDERLLARMSKEKIWRWTWRIVIKGGNFDIDKHVQDAGIFAINIFAMTQILCI